MAAGKEADYRVCSDGEPKPVQLQDAKMSATLQQVLEQMDVLREKAKARGAAEGRVPKASLQSKQPPSWTTATHGVPNSVLRSALFGAVKKGRRTFLQGETLAAVDRVSVLFTGPRLDQSDLDVWEQCLHLARCCGGLGTPIRFSAHRFLREIKRNTGKSQHEWLRNAFRRLAASVVEIKDGHRAYFGPMIHHGIRDDIAGQYVIEINPAIVVLYDSNGWTALEWGQRLALKKQPLAQWLHGFYSTHKKPYAYRVETLHRLCGSENEQLAGFRRDLRDALVRLQAATGWCWEIDDADLVKVRKIPQRAEIRRIEARHSAHRGTA